MLQSNQITIKFGTAEARRLNWAWMTFSDPPSLAEVQFKRLPWNSPFHSSRCHLGTVTTQKPYRGSFITTDIYNRIFSLLIVDGKFMKWYIFSSGLELLALLQRRVLLNVNQIGIFISCSNFFFYLCILASFLCKAPFCVNQPKIERLVKMQFFRYQNSKFQGLS